ncbi:MAG: hypothetical protein AUI14_19515 [Actinobacteria bacterium 13_2_20CM_2_71_6]|nr:MAG: hypothetical protein AUI14_19515 [Actinobacteria bacterium 13_2_20CM_2_71_6]
MRSILRGPVPALLAAVSLALAACGHAARPAAAPTSAAAGPTGSPLSHDDIVALAAQFHDQPLTGGQHAPRLYRWVNDRVLMFLQFDNPDPAKATALRYVGVAVKGVFCAEAQPGGPNGGFPHFHRLDAPDYAHGHGGPPGTPGYWLSWVAVDTFTLKDGRQVKPGVDYQEAPTPAPTCGANVPKVDFAGPGAKALTGGDIAAFWPLFADQPLTGGQHAPRQYRWVNPNTLIFLQFDNPDAAKATALRYVGIAVRGRFCKSKQPTPDFPHFHRTDAPDYAHGHGGPPDTAGYWLLWLATDTFATHDGRQVTPGVDRQLSPTPAPDC